MRSVALARSDTLQAATALSEGLKASTREKAAIAAIVVGGIAVIGGAIAYGLAAKRRTRTLRDTLGRVQARVNRGGMTLTHHYDPDMPIEQRVGFLQDLVWKGVQNPQMRELALAITGSGTRDVIVGKRKFRVKGANCPARDGLCEAEAIYNWTKENVRYTGDIAPVKMPTGDVEGVDLFQTGLRTVEFGGGDCDDHSSLTATLLALNGIPAKFRITAPSKSSDWAHIYSMAGLPKTRPQRWVPLDTTLPGQMFGREAPYAKHMDFVA
jgi:hypothetical protein